MRILCVCGTGQGSSLILKMSVQDILKRKGYRQIWSIRMLPVRAVTDVIL